MKPKIGDVLYMASPSTGSVRRYSVWKVGRKFFNAGPERGVINLIDNPPAGAVRGFFTDEHSAKNFETIWREGDRDADN